MVGRCNDSMHYIVFFFKQKTAYEMRISDWSSDVCSSDLLDFCRLDAICRNRYFCARLSSHPEMHEPFPSSYLASCVPNLSYINSKSHFRKFPATLFARPAAF